MPHIEFDMSILDPALLQELDEFIEVQEFPQESIIAILHKAQELFLWLPRELQLHIARKTDLPAARIHGIVSFYSFFLEEPNGKYTVSVCMGTACFVKGAQPILDEFRKQLGMGPKDKITKDGVFSLNDVRCIGACGLAPVVRINEKIYGHFKVEQVKEVIQHYRELEEQAQ